MESSEVQCGFKVLEQTEIKRTSPMLHEFNLMNVDKHFCTHS